MPQIERPGSALDSHRSPRSKRHFVGSNEGPLRVNVRSMVSKHALFTFFLGLVALAALVTASAAPAAGQNRPVPNREAAWQTLRGVGWTLSAPPTWELHPVPPVPEPAQLILLMRAPSRSGTPNVNVVQEPVAGHTSQEFARAAIDYVVQSQAGQIHATREVSNGAVRTLEVETTWPNNVPPTRSLQRYFVVGPAGITVTCSEIAERFESARATCARVLGSFAAPGSR